MIQLLIEQREEAATWEMAALQNRITELMPYGVSDESICEQIRLLKEKENESTRLLSRLDVANSNVFVKP